MKRFFRALGFLTILPVPRDGEESKIPLSETAPFFPLVGLLIGILTYAVFWYFSHWFHWRQNVLWLLILPVVLSGGLHLDGWSDFCDGFFSARASREEILRIMKDSRIGVMGALGLVLILLAKYELLVSVGVKPAAFIFMPVASRTVQVATAFFLPYAGAESGMGKNFVGQISRNDLYAALTCAAFIGLFAGPWLVLLEFLFLAGFIALFCSFAKKKLGGATGDVIGAAGELSELLFLMVAAGAVKP